MNKFKVLFAFAFLLSACQPSSVNEKVTSSSSASSNFSDGKYENGKHHYSFSYPSDWKLTEANNGDFVQLITKETKNKADYIRQNDIGTEYAMNDFSVSYCPNINSGCSLFGGDWTGKREYENLTDFISEPSSKVRIGGNVKNTFVGKERAYEIVQQELPIQTILLEHNGIFILTFESGRISDPLIRQLLNSWQFTD